MFFFPFFFFFHLVLTMVHVVGVLHTDPPCLKLLALATTLLRQVVSEGEALKVAATLNKGYTMSIPLSCVTLWAFDPGLSVFIYCAVCDAFLL